MSIFRYATDTPYGRPWAERVGKLILNFSAAEMTAVLWAVQMSEDPARIPAIVKMRFMKRVSLIRELISGRAFTEEWRERSLGKWDEAALLARTRNRLAHNPLTFQWETDPPEGEPSLIGIPDFAGTGDDEFMTTAEIDAAVNETAAIVPALRRLLDEWCVTRDERAS